MSTGKMIIEEVVEHFVKGLIDPSYLYQEEEE